MAVAIALGALAVGQFVVGQQQSRAFRANARTLRQQAQDALRLGQIEADRIRRSGERVQGDLRAIAGASGVELSGSPLAVAVDQAIEIDREARVALFNSEQQARALQAEAEAQRRAGKNAFRAAPLNAATTFLTGGVNLGIFNTGGGAPPPQPPT